MSYIVKRLNIRGNRGERVVNCLFDTGAGYSFIKEEIAKEIGDIIKFPTKMKFKLADGKTHIEVSEKIILEIKINGHWISDEVVVIKELSEDMLIGVNTMQKWRIKLDLESESVKINPEVIELKLLKI